MVLRQVGEEQRQAGGHPAVAATPEVRGVGRVEEETVGALEPVEIGDHRPGRAVEVDGVARGAERAALQGGDHVHVVDPEPGLVAQTCGVGAGPLRIGVAEPERAEAGVAGGGGEGERQRAEDGVVDVVGRRHERGLRREKRREARGEPGRQVVVRGGRGEVDGAGPHADLASRAAKSWSAVAAAKSMAPVHTQTSE